jgi:hypothetical protein
MSNTKQNSLVIGCDIKGSVTITFSSVSSGTFLSSLIFPFLVFVLLIVFLVLLFLVFLVFFVAAVFAVFVSLGVSFKARLL